MYSSTTDVVDSEIEDATSMHLHHVFFTNAKWGGCASNFSIQRNKKYTKPPNAKETSNPISPVVRAIAPVNGAWFVQGITTSKDNTLAAPAAIPGGRCLKTFHWHAVMSYSEGTFLRKQRCSKRIMAVYIEVQCPINPRKLVMVTENRWAPTIERGTTLFYINKLTGTSIKLSDDWYKHEQKKKNHLHSSCYHRKYVSRYCDQDRDECLEIEWNVTTLLPATERLSRTIRNLPKLPPRGEASL